MSPSARAAAASAASRGGSRAVSGEAMVRSMARRSPQWPRRSYRIGRGTSGGPSTTVPRRRSVLIIPCLRSSAQASATVPELTPSSWPGRGPSAGASAP
ncbi:hypothetical protein ACFQQB_46290 [Nonomuraea rubra]|uniref:hypothetical protein n=1 Tax=Nonomuraea rubra TaxID=46180 RepID=UPI003622C9AE